MSLENNATIAEIVWELMNSAFSSLDIGYRHYVFLIYRLIYGEFPPISSSKPNYLFDIDEEWFITKIPKMNKEKL